MDRQPTLEDERLLLRPLRPDDWGALWTIASDRELWAVHPANDRWREPVFREFFADALAQGILFPVIEVQTIEQDASSVGPIQAGQQFDQCGFAGTILTHQSQ